MLAYVLVALGVAVAVLGAWLSASQLVRVRSAVSSDAESGARRLARLPDADRPAALERAAQPGTWEADLARALANATDEAPRIAAVNEAVAELGLRLDERAGWPSAAVRLSAFGTMLLAVVAVIAQRVDLVLPLVGIGGAGVLVCAELARRSRAEAVRRKKAVDALVGAVLPLSPSPGPGTGRRVRSGGTFRTPR